MLIDSSVIVKYFSKELGWEKLENYVNENMTLGFALCELGSALAKKVRRGETDAKYAADILLTYSEGASLLNEKRYLDLAFKYAASGRIKMYDGLFVAAAMQEGQALISCDKKQCDFAESLGIDVIRCY